MKKNKFTGKLLISILLLTYLLGCTTANDQASGDDQNSKLQSYAVYYDETELSRYKSLTIEQRASLAQKYYQENGIGLIQTKDGVLNRYSVPDQFTPLKDLMIINNENVDDYPVWDRDVLLTGSIKSHVPVFSIKPGVTVYFGYDDIVDEYDGNGDWADIEIFGDVSFKGTYQKRIHFLPVSEHPEAEDYYAENGGKKEFRNEAAPGMQILFYQKPSARVEIEYCVFRDFAHIGLNIMSEESGPIEVSIKYNLFNIRLGLGSPRFGNISGAVEYNYFTDPEYSTECLDLYNLSADDTMIISNNQIGPAFGGQHWASVMTPINSLPRAEHNVFFLVRYHSNEQYYDDSPYVVNNKFIGTF